MVEVADVIDAVEEHREAFDAHAERVAAPNVRVIADGLEHCRIDHAAAADFDPWPLHFREMRGGEVDFEAGLGVAEVVRAETRLGVFAEERREDVVEQRLQVADGDVLVDVEALELVDRKSVV